MTNIELIGRALLKLGVINESETPSAEQGIDALHELNQMLEEWEESGIKLGWCEQADADLSNTAPLPPYAERGVTLKLALALAPSYGGAASVTPALVADAEDAFSIIRRKAALKALKPSRMDNMPASESSGYTYDIQTG